MHQHDRHGGNPLVVADGVHFFPYVNREILQLYLNRMCSGVDLSKKLQVDPAPSDARTFPTQIGMNTTAVTFADKAACIREQTENDEMNTSKLIAAVVSDLGIDLSGKPTVLQLDIILEACTLPCIAN